MANRTRWRLTREAKEKTDGPVWPHLAPEVAPFPYEKFEKQPLLWSVYNYGYTNGSIGGVCAGLLVGCVCTCVIFCSLAIK